MRLLKCQEETLQYIYSPPPVLSLHGFDEEHVFEDFLKKNESPCYLTQLQTTPKRLINEWRQIGFQLIANNKVASLILAGGQGTRLGWNKPKGTFPIGGVSKKSFFSLLCEKHKAISKLAHEALGISPQTMTFPLLYIMTSEVTHLETTDFFKEHQYFGLEEDRVIFFQQDAFPTFNLNGKILLQSKGKLSESPNGNGGLFKALKDHKIINDMITRNLFGFHVFTVDNPLTKVLDPVLLGYAKVTNAPIVNKCIPRKNFSEKVGIICVRENKDKKREPVVVEYGEIASNSEAVQKMFQETTNDAEHFKFCSANICNHFFRLNFVNTLLQNIHTTMALPIHAALKKIPHLDITTGAQVIPKAPNGVKLEMFIFDSFLYAENVAVLEVSRKEEFAPLKNEKGEDSIESVRNHCSNVYKEWLQQVGATFQGEGFLEISPTVSYQGENLQGYKNAVLQLPCYIHETRQPTSSKGS